MSWLQGTFPCIDAAVLLEVLQVNDFSPRYYWTSFFFLSPPPLHVTMLKCAVG